MQKKRRIGLLMVVMGLTVATVPGTRRRIRPSLPPVNSPAWCGIC